MKFESRLLISQLCAAGATGLLSSLLIAGCASGERTGRFWNKGDVASSDAYASAALARDQDFAANANPSTPASDAKVASTGGTQDGKGRVAMSDTSDTPPPPLVSDSDPSANVPAPPSAKVASLSPNPVPTSSVAAGSTGTGVAAAGAAAGSVQVAGAAAGGRIIAPYVQKRPPSGVVDNNNHDSEIVKPKQVLAKQLDPFAATDAPLYATPASTRPKAAPAAALASAASSARAPMSPVPADPTPVDAALVDRTHTGSTPATVPVGQVTLSNGDGNGETAGTTAPPTSPAGPSSLAAVPNAAPAGDAFDPSLPPPAPIASRASSAGTASSDSATTPWQPAPQHAAAPESAPSVSAHPNPSYAAKRNAPMMPSRPHTGIRLGDEDLDAEPQASSQSAVQPAVEPASVRSLFEGPQSVAAEAPYEAEPHHEAGAQPCVMPPSPPAPQPAGATSPSKPVQDTWESRKNSPPAPEPVHSAVAPPIAVTAAPSAQVEQTQPTAATSTIIVPAKASPSNAAPSDSPEPSSAAAPPARVSTSPVSVETAWAQPAAPEPHHTSIQAAAAPFSDVSTATKSQSSEWQAIPGRSARLASAGSAATVPQAALYRGAPSHASHQSESAEHESTLAAPAQVEVVVNHAGSDPMVCDSASVHGRYTGDENAPSAAAPPPKPQPAAAPAVPAKPVPPAAKKLTRKPDTANEGKSTSFWDDSLMTPAGKHTVSTADFSVAAPAMPADADDVHTAGAKLAVVSASGAGRTTSDPQPAKTRAGVVVGMVIGLVASAVVWRRWRHSGEPEVN